MKRLIIWLCCVFCMSGCVADYPQDIAIVSIKVVDNREQAERDGPANSDSFSFLDK